MELTLIFMLIIFSFIIAMKTSISRNKTIIPSISFKNYSIANNQGTKLQITLSVLGTNLGGAITIGFIGLIYRGGTVFYIAGLSFLVGLVLLYATIPKIRRYSIDNNITSFEDYISGGNNYLKILISIINLFTFIGLLASQLISLKIILLLRFPQFSEWLFPLIFASVVLYTAIYGLRGIMENDKIQLFVIMFWILSILYVLLSDINGVIKISSLSPEMLNGLSMGIPFIIVVVIFLPWTVLTRADYWQRIVASESNHTAQSAFGTLIFVMFFMYTLFLVLGLYLAANMPNLAYNEAPFEILKSLPSEFVIFAVIGIFAALISSADSFLNISAISIISLLSSINKLIFKNHQYESLKEEDKALGFIYRITTIIVGIFTYILIIFYDNLGAWIIMATTAVGLIVPSFIGNIINPKSSKIPSIISISIGILSYILILILKIVSPDEVFVIAILITSIAYVVSQVVFGKLFKKEKKNDN